MIGAATAFLIGFVLLVVASGRFVAGATGISLRLRISAVVVGAIVVGFGTSAPELLVSALAAAEGARDIAAGNIVGSNLANLTLVLGAVGVVAAPVITSRFLVREVPLVIGALVALAAGLHHFTRWTAVALAAAFVVTMVLLLREA